MAMTASASSPLPTTALLSSCSCSAAAGDQVADFSGAAWPEYVMETVQEKKFNCNGDTNNLSDSSMVQEQNDDDEAHDDTSPWMDSFEADEDNAFWATFLDRISTARQVPRYCGEPNARPLWAVASGSLPDGAVPPCSQCRAPLRFELQVTPQLLDYFGVEAGDPDPLGWATIVVYTCAVSCDGDQQSGGYKEFAWVQLQPKKQ